MQRIKIFIFLPSLSSHLPFLETWFLPFKDCFCYLQFLFILIFLLNFSVSKKSLKKDICFNKLFSWSLQNSRTEPHVNSLLLRGTSMKGEQLAEPQWICPHMLCGTYTTSTMKERKFKLFYTYKQLLDISMAFTLKKIMRKVGWRLKFFIWQIFIKDIFHSALDFC